MNQMIVLILVFIRIVCLHCWSSEAELSYQRILQERKDNSYCNQNKWQDSYTELHKILLQQGTKLIVFIPNLSGMADRIIGFTTVLLIGILTNRAFQMGSRKELPDFGSAFLSNSINWTRAQDPDWLIEPLSLKPASRNYNATILESKEFFGVNTINDYKLQDRLIRKDLNEIMGGNDVKTTLISINRGKTIRMIENPYYTKTLQHMGLTSHNTFECLVNYLIQPKREIFTNVYEEYLRMTDPDPNILKIAIQIRVGDHSWTTLANENNVNLQHYQAYFSCATQIEQFASKLKNYSEVVWYLLTEHQPLRLKAKQYYGDKLLTNLNVRLEHSSKENSVCKTENCTVSDLGFKTAAAEWWLMAYSDYFVISRYSGYGRSAAFRSPKRSVRNNIYTIMNGKGGDANVQCDNTSFTELLELSYDWSGV